MNKENYKKYLYMGLIALILFLGLNNYIFARSSSVGGFIRGGSCCAPSSTVDTTEELRVIGLNFYVSKYGDDNVDAVVKDFGCHQEIHIYQGEVLLTRIAYVNGQVFEL
jgi:hypothetical protein